MNTSTFLNAQKYKEHQKLPQTQSSDSHLIIIPSYHISLCIYPYKIDISGII